MKGRSETSGVTLIVGFLLAVAAISVMTDAMSGMLTQTSETSETDQLSEIANDISKQCENAVADNPIGGDYETEVKISPGTVLRFPGGSNRRLEAEIAATEDSRSWQIPDECEYEFTGEGSGDTLKLSRPISGISGSLMTPQRVTHSSAHQTVSDATGLSASSFYGTDNEYLG